MGRPSVQPPPDRVLLKTVDVRRTVEIVRRTGEVVRKTVEIVRSAARK
jgi:hypothetical protein